MGTIEKKDVPNILAPRGTAKIISSWVEGWHLPGTNITRPTDFGEVWNIIIFKMPLKGYMFSSQQGTQKLLLKQICFKKNLNLSGILWDSKVRWVTGTCFFWPSRKNMSQIGNLLQVGVKNWKIKYVRTHHFEEKSRQFIQFTTLHLSIIRELSSGPVTILTTHL